jgi:hypothetical protein
MRKIRKWLPVLAAALVGAIALSAPAQAAPAATALRASVKAAAPAVAPFAVINGNGKYGHTCESLGNDQGRPKAVPTQGVICIQIVVQDLGTGAWLVTAESQGICQKITQPRTNQQCANINMWSGASIAHTDGTNIKRGFNLLSCGHGTNPKCSTGATFFSGAGWVIPDGECWLAWGTIAYNLANDTPATSIELPGSALTVSMQPVPLYFETKLAFKVGNGC